MKRRLTKDQEFDILKLVLDKYLWLGTLVMIFGLYKIFTAGAGGFLVSGAAEGVIWILGGSVVFFVLLYVIIKEYEFIA